MRNTLFGISDKNFFTSLGRPVGSPLFEAPCSLPEVNNSLVCFVFVTQVAEEETDLVVSNNVSELKTETETLKENQRIADYRNCSCSS
jgi:hypothetical protein